ncbi:MAG: hypothetical protein KKD73_10175 [Proteobacteria bacterium]|nr:hypothetical protein [Pseudomonadota bacterium]
MKRNLSWFDRIMMAITFAEANCPEEARGYLDGGDTTTLSHKDTKNAEGREMRIAHAGVNH